MSKIDDGGPAFAHAGTDGPEGYPGAQTQVGMSLRDYLAGQALQGFMVYYLDQPQRAIDTVEKACSQYASAAYRMADAMIAARKGGAA